MTLDQLGALGDFIGGIEVHGQQAADPLGGDLLEGEFRAERHRGEQR